MAEVTSSSLVGSTLRYGYFAGKTRTLLVFAGLLIVVLVAVIGSNYLVASRSRARGEASPRVGDGLLDPDDARFTSQYRATMSFRIRYDYWVVDLFIRQ